MNHWFHMCGTKGRWVKPSGADTGIFNNIIILPVPQLIQYHQWLLMPLFHESPGHQQWWNRLYIIDWWILVFCKERFQLPFCGWEITKNVDISIFLKITLTWDNKAQCTECTEEHMFVMCLDTQWHFVLKNSRQEPTPSNGSLPQSMAAPPARRVLGMRTRSFNKTGFDWLIDWLNV